MGRPAARRRVSASVRPAEVTTAWGIFPSWSRNAPAPGTSMIPSTRVTSCASSSAASLARSPLGTGQEPAQGVQGLASVRVFKQFADVDSVLPCEIRPQVLNDGRGIDEGSVHVKEQGPGLQRGERWGFRNHAISLTGVPRVWHRLQMA